MGSFTPLPAIVGGALIGLSAAILWVANGRVAGISGIVGGLLAPLDTDFGWRAAFIAGMLAAALLYRIAGTEVPDVHNHIPLAVEIIAGVLVGFGTRLGGGCTSGHGVCGLARFSGRSLVATGVFLFMAALTVFVSRHLMGVR